MVHSKKIGYIIASCIVLACSVAARWQWQQQVFNRPTVAALNVGQGDAIYIHTQQGADVLIDGGPDRRVLEQLGQVMPFWDRTIELVVLTHSHADHLNGLLTVLDYYDIQNVWLVKMPQEKNVAYQLWLQQLAEHHVAIHYVQAGYNWSLSDSENLQVLYPFTDSNVNTMEDLNDTSLVIKYSLDAKEALFMGDATSVVEGQLLSRGVVQPAEILKVGHHGSRYSSSPEFLAAVQPNYAIISAGIDNSYHHPHTETLQRLQTIGANIIRTDIFGTATLLLGP